MKYSTRIRPISSSEKAKDTMALVKILALRSKEVAAGKVYPAAEAIRVVRKRITR